MVLLASLLLVSCAQPARDTEAGLRIATSLPIFESILNELVSSDDVVYSLLGENDSPHDYQPRPSDVKAFTDADIVILGHEHLDGWASKLTDQPIYFLVAEQPGHMDEENPHFWFDPTDVIRSTATLADILCGIRESACIDYQSNYLDFAASVTVLDSVLAQIVAPLKDQVFIVSRPFFDPFLDRYHIRSLATLEPSPGHSVSPSDVIGILKQVGINPPIGIIAQPHVSDGIVSLVQQETGLAIVYVSPVGSKGVPYNEFMLATARSLTSLTRN
jgi:ABC-type Zn uptake system ZnuABC Zn-binding protein ZnuA